MSEIKTKTNDVEMVHPELAAIEVEGTERSDVLMKGALAAGAIFGLGAISPFLKGALGAGGGKKGDLEVLNYALTLEYLESAFYAEALKKAGVKGKLKELVQTLSTDEDAHVKALSQTIRIWAASRSRRRRSPSRTRTPPGSRPSPKRSRMSASALTTAPPRRSPRRTCSRRPAASFRSKLDMPPRSHSRTEISPPRTPSTRP
jgi:hypothetical protein